MGVNGAIIADPYQKGAQHTCIENELWNWKFWTEHSVLNAKWKFSFAFACAVDLEILKEAPRCHTESAEEKIGAWMVHSFRHHDCVVGG